MDTERLTLRRLSPEDEAAFLTGLEDAELRRLYGFPTELPRETALRIFQQFAALPAAWGIVRREDGALTGFLLDVDLELPEADRRALPEGGRTLAFATFRPYQRQGYMREALRAIIGRHLRAKDAPFLHAGHFPFNGPSRALLQALGFRPYGERRLGTALIVDEILFL